MNQYPWRPNLYTIADGVAVVELGNGKCTIVDSSDWELLKGYMWRLRVFGHNHYAVNSTRGMMHRMITGFHRTDHINRNGLDNRRCNLREASHADNLRNRGRQSNNSSGYKGVSRASKATWKAMIQYCGRDIYLGSFPNKELAALAYDAAARQYFKEFAYTNF